MNIRDALVALGVMIIWGFNMPFAKYAMAQMSPIMMIALRFALTAALLLPFAKFPRGRIGAIALLSCTLGTVHFSLMFSGINGTDAALAAILSQTQVPFAALLAWAAFGDRPGWRGVLGQVVAFAGIFVLAGEPGAASNIGAVLLCIAGSLMWAVSTIQLKKLGAINGTSLNAWIALLAVPQLLVVSAIVEDGQIEAVRSADWRLWASIVYQAVGVVIIGYVVWFRMLARYSVSQTMPYTLLVPLFGVLGGHVFLGEPITWERIVGGLLIITGVAIILIRNPPPAADAATPPAGPSTT